MAFPTAITGIITPYSKPFLSSGGNVYLIARDATTSSKVRAFKATDPSTSFSNIGTDFTVTSGNAVNDLAVYQVSDTLHVVTKDISGTTVSLRYHTFSMSSDTWTLTNEAISTAFSIVVDSVRDVDISVRSDGDVIVFYNGPLVANMGTNKDRTYYARREAGTWTVDVAVDTIATDNWFAGGIVKGASDRMHLFYLNATNSDGWHRSLSSTNVLDTAATFDTATISGSNTATANYGDSYDSGGTIKVRLAYLSSTANTTNVVKLDSGANPTMTLDSDITGTTVVSGPSGKRSTMATDGTDLYVTYADTNLDTFYSLNSNDAGWPAAGTQIRAASIDLTGSPPITSKIYTRGGTKVLALLYTDAGAETYDELVLSAPDDTLYGPDFMMDFGRYRR